MSSSTHAKIALGDVFGNLTVIFTGQKPRYDTVRCKCGHEFRKTRYRLVKDSESGKLQTCRHCKAIGDPLTPEQAHLASTYFKLARYQAHKLVRWKSRFLDDAESAAMIALIKAIKSHNPDRKKAVSLAKYILAMVSYEVIDEIEMLRRKERHRDDLVSRVENQANIQKRRLLR